MLLDYQTFFTALQELVNGQDTPMPVAEFQARLRFSLLDRELRNVRLPDGVATFNMNCPWLVDLRNKPENRELRAFYLAYINFISTRNAQKLPQTVLSFLFELSRCYRERQQRNLSLCELRGSLLVAKNFIEAPHEQARTEQLEVEMKRCYGAPKSVERFLSGWMALHFALLFSVRMGSARTDSSNAFLLDVLCTLAPLMLSLLSLVVFARSSRHSLSFELDQLKDEAIQTIHKAGH